nr:coiled-coil domain-containing protein 60-like [Ciona intestinalis]|eukprot:XP_009860110.2 coiled-coil domain-containing protein 60-like [Ciona intestinalis]
MSPSLVEDARNYITIKPVPVWSEVKESKLQARSLNHYCLSLPTREKVFKTNYERRFHQYTSQGYKSYPWKPYQEVGQPLYLDSKLLVQTSLGQLSDNGGKQEEKSDNNEKEHGRRGILTQKSKKQSRQMSTASFVMKHREQKDLQNLVKDLLSVKQTMTKVKMGHALFPMLEEEQNRRETAFLVQKQNQMKTTKGMQPPKPADDTTAVEELLKQEFSRDPPVSPVPKKMSLKRVGSLMAMPIDQQHATPMPTTPSTSMVAKKAEVHIPISERVRPFTPFSSNIGFPIHDKGDHVTESVWKQLCVVHWILLACEVEDNVDDQFQYKVMIPIIECWNKVNSGGKTRDSRIITQEKRNNNKWTKFTRAPSHRILARMKTRKKQLNLSMRRNASHASDLSGYHGDRLPRPPSARSILGTLVNNDSVEDFEGEYGSPTRPSSAGQSSVATTVAGWTMGGSEFGDDETATDAGGSIMDGRKESDLHERDYHEHLQKLLSTVGESVRREMDRRERTAKIIADQNGTLPLSVYEWSRNSYFKIGNKEVNISKIVVPQATEVTDYSSPPTIHKSPTNVKIRPHTAVATRRRTSVMQGGQDNPPSRPGTATGAARVKIKRPMSSPAKLSSQFLFKFSSDEKEKSLGQIRDRFDEVNDSKALQLHNQLSELEKRRKQRMETKFDMLTRTKSIHRDLKGMRSAAQQKFLQEQLIKKKRSCLVSCDWYTMLSENIPDEVHRDQGCEEVLEKLFMLGMQMEEGMRQVTEHSFLSSLRVLRSWELCSPEISSGIEFVREHIVGMKSENFDEWRSSKLGHKEAIKGCESKKKLG